MSIIRAPRPESGWYLLDKRLSEDSRLSWAARGMLIYLLGKPDNWRVSIEQLRKQTEEARVKTGRDGVYALIGELIDAGFITRSQSRSGGGAFGSIDYVVSESPLPAEPDAVDQPPLPAEPYTAEPLPAKTTLTKTVRAPRIERATNTVDVVDQSGDDGFDAWWAAYPKKVGKKPAKAIWNRRKLGKMADELIRDVKVRAATDDGWKRGYVPNPATYLNQDRWDDAIRTSPEQGRGPPVARAHKTPEETKAELAAAASRKPVDPARSKEIIGGIIGQLGRRQPQMEGEC